LAFYAEDSTRVRIEEEALLFGIFKIDRAKKGATSPHR